MPKRKTSLPWLNNPKLLSSTAATTSFYFYVKLPVNVTFNNVPVVTEFDYESNNNLQVLGISLKEFYVRNIL